MPQLGHRSGSQTCADVIADNWLAENAGWDPELLALTLQYLSELERRLDATITRSSMAEIKLLLEELKRKPRNPGPADAVPAILVQLRNRRRDGCARRLKWTLVRLHSSGSRTYPSMNMSEGARSR